MAHKTLNFSFTWRPKPSLPVEGRALLHFPRRRVVLPPTLVAVGCRAGTRIVAAGRGESDGSGNLGVVRERKGVRKNVDIATLGNLCVDVVLDIPSLPPASTAEHRAYMERLEASPPDKKFWEAGGNCNLAIAASRLGLSCVTLGHVGDEIYGNFLLDVLSNENIRYVGMSQNMDDTASIAAYETLLCWVLVDPFQKHGFWSRADFSEEPAFSWMSELTEEVKKAIQQTKILFCNGYTFDELSPDLIISALDCAIHAGTSIIFYPGPRGRALLHGTLEEQRALELLLRQSDVLLLTSDEVESLTGIKNPIQAAQELISRGERTKWVIIKLGSKGSILINRSTVSCAPSFKSAIVNSRQVNVVDTVGCGDSFAAAIAFGFLHRMPAVNTLALANAVGAATATGCGAGRNVAHLNKVLELLRQSNIDEDGVFWGKLFEDSSRANEVMLLSKVPINGHKNRFVRIPIRNVVVELLPKFEKTSARSMV
ncbi:pfkB family carbohydrate kinase [Musa troglodytarum]|uniref:PfkB family carbohydrate kinase n=1 Tax=Musa troglodytarum TaxID=320322 RepID=A0A9E7E8X5_9LILI|nr:pfkB family carbohydrate kinase [Musa troglodytarum]